MITLITGKPGSGKSLLAVEMILDNSKADSIRPCYSNIDGLDCKSLLCFSLDEPDQWHKLPDGSLIIIDEAQDWMPPRPSGRAVPEQVDLLNKHRHQGFDVVLMTPDPMLLDVTARKTVGRHLHCYRPFGVEHRKVFEWNGCNDSPEPSKNESNALVTKKPFDKSLFSYYKSAEVHTHKPRLPYKKFVLFLGSLFFAVFLFGYSFYSIYESGQDVSDSVVGVVDESVSVFDDEIIDEAVFSVVPVALSAVPSVYYRGRYSVSGHETILLELPSGESVRLLDFDSYSVEGFTVFLYLGGSDSPVFRVDHPVLARHLKG